MDNARKISIRDTYNRVMENIVNPDPNRGGKVMQTLQTVDDKLYSMTPRGREDAARRRIMVKMLDETRERRREARARQEAGDPNWEQSFGPEPSGPSY